MSTGLEAQRVAFNKLSETIRAVPREEQRHVNLDLPGVFTTIYKTLARARVYEPQVAKLEFTDHPAIMILPDLVLAGLYIENEIATTSQTANELGPKVEEGTALAQVMVADIKALVLRKVLPMDALADYNSGNGYHTLATNLGLVARLADRHWAAIEGRSGITRADIDRAGELNQEIFKYLGERATNGGDLAQLAVLRAQNFTLIVRAYDELRRAIAYLRYHEGDVDEIAPSLFANRGGNRSRKDEKVTPVATKPQFGDSQLQDSAQPGQDLPPISKDGPFR
jgi:hypothetical protein